MVKFYKFGLIVYCDAHVPSGKCIHINGIVIKHVFWNIWRSLDG